MKRTKVMIMAMIFMLCFASAAFAQRTIEMQIPMTTSVSGQIKLYIPFDFVVAGQDFAKGEYYLTPMNDRTLAVKSVDDSKSAVVLTNLVASIAPSEGPKIIFHRYGDRTFLAQAWSSYSESGRQLVSSAEEVKLAKIYNQQQIALMIKK